MSEKLPQSQSEYSPTVDESSTFEEIEAAVNFHFDRFHTLAIHDDWEKADEAIAEAQRINGLHYGTRGLPSLINEVGSIRRQAQIQLALGEYQDARWKIRSLGYPLSEYDCGEEGLIVDFLRDIAKAGLAHDEIVQSPLIQQALRLIP